MPLVSLDLINFRSFEKASLQLHPNRNLIFGGNAAGKSSLLEAIYFLSTCKSSRASSQEKLIRSGTEYLHVKGIISGPTQATSLSVHYGQGKKQLQIDGDLTAKIGQLAKALPVLAVTPEGHYEFQQHSKIRRGVLDWILFHVEQDYQTIWTRYYRCLAQRNAELRRTTSPRSITIWDEELALHGDAMQDRRAEATVELGRHFTNICAQILPNVGRAELILKSGWNHDDGMRIELSRCLESDRQRGFTQTGPHRNDLSFKFNELKTYQDLSHGQKKLVYMALRSAQASYLRECCGIGCVFLIDDVSAELDDLGQRRVYSLLADFPSQVIVTSLESETWAENWPEYRSFHVKHGIAELATEK